MIQTSNGTDQSEIQHYLDEQLQLAVRLFVADGISGIRVFVDQE